MWIIYVALAAFFGGIVNALLGWTKTTDPFDLRKFISSAIAAFIGAAVIAATFNYASVTMPLSLLLAFLSGAGVTAGASRIAGSVAARKNY